MLFTLITSLKGTLNDQFKSFLKILVKQNTFIIMAIEYDFVNNVFMIDGVTYEVYDIPAVVREALSHVEQIEIMFMQLDEGLREIKR